jgi:predicted ferric reductase
LRFIANIDFWVGFSFLVPTNLPAFDSDSPLLAIVRDIAVPVVPSAMSSLAETAVFLSKSGNQLRFVVSSRSTPIDVTFNITRGVDTNVILRMRRNAVSGTLRWFLNGTRVVLVDGDPVGNLTLDSQFMLEPMPVLALEPGWTVPRGGSDATLLIKSIRVAIGEGRELVDPDAPRYGGKGIVEEPIVDPAQRCIGRPGALRCGCIRNTTCADDGAFCSFFGNETGVCDFAPAMVTVPANCTSLGTDGCPCYRLGCRSGLTCDRSGARGTINFCFDGRPKVVPAPPNPETGYSCLEADPSPWHVVPGPADWFVVIITIIVLALSFARWSMKLLTRNLLASSSDDDQIKLMTEQGVLSTQMHFEAFGNNGDGGANARPADGPGSEEYNSASLAVDKREFYRPLPPSENANAFDHYRKLPDPPSLANVPQIQDGALQRVHIGHAQHEALEQRARRRSLLSKEYQRHTFMQTDASGKRSVRSVVAFLWHGRIPGSQARLRDAILAALFVLLHVLFFVGFQDPCLAAQIAGDEWRLRARAVASTFGYIASADGLLLVVPATRNSVLTILLGLEFDETILFHRWLGRWTLLMLLLHGLIYFPIWFDDWESFVQYRVPLPKFAYALVSGIGSLLLAIFSLEYFRRNYFQVFYWSHYLFLAFYIAGGLHSPKVFARLAIAAMILYVVDRLVRFITGVWPRRCIENTALGGNCTRVVFPKSRLARYAVGNYVFLNFPQISLTEWHPFTLSSGPHDDNNECHIKALGDFTNKVYDMTTKAMTLRTKLWVRVDGPYGKFSLNLERYPVVVLIGGGVGITPQIAALKSIYRICMSNVARVDNLRRTMVKHVYFVWSSPDPEHYWWFADFFQQCVQRRLDDMTYPELHLFIHLTRFKEAPPGLPDYVLPGRPELHQLMSIICGERKAELSGAQGAVFACGPTEMVNGAWDAAIAASTKYSYANMLFHRETFDY